MKIKDGYHGRLFGFAGFSGAGKTTLIEKLIKKLSSYKIGYIKHDAHFFEMDREGKDTYRQYHAGAQCVYINDNDHFAFQGRGDSFNLEKAFFQDCDFLFVEGYKYSNHSKLLFLDDDGIALKEYEEGKITNVIGIIHNNENAEPIQGLPSFKRDDLEKISQFIVGLAQEKILQTKLSALILVGGKSTRMGEDKASLDYWGKPQYQHLIEMFDQLGIPAYLSCRPDQGTASRFSAFRKIEDRFIDFGPLGGILSAMSFSRDQAWIVMACDIPLITEENIKELIAKRNPYKQATAYFNEERKQFEPLFAIYEPSIYSRMLYFLGEGFICPQKVLFNSSVEIIALKKQSFLENANTPDERNRIKSLLNE